MWDYLSMNKQWVFSGIGVFFLANFLGWIIWVLKKKTLDSNAHATDLTVTCARFVIFTRGSAKRRVEYRRGCNIPLLVGYQF